MRERERELIRWTDSRRTYVGFDPGLFLSNTCNQSLFILKNLPRSLVVLFYSPRMSDLTNRTQYHVLRNSSIPHVIRDKSVNKKRVRKTTRKKNRTYWVLSKILLNPMGFVKSHTHTLSSPTIRTSVRIKRNKDRSWSWSYHVRRNKVWISKQVEKRVPELSSTPSRTSPYQWRFMFTRGWIVIKLHVEKLKCYCTFTILKLSLVWSSWVCW